jgi:hypothetical protein
LKENDAGYLSDIQAGLYVSSFLTPIRIEGMTMRESIFAILKLPFILASFVFILGTGMGIVEWINFRAVNPEDIPATFPIIVVWEENQALAARALYYKDLPQFVEEKPNVSYLIPQDKEEEIRQIIYNSCRAIKEPPDFNQGSPDPWSASFIVKDVLPDGSQHIRASCTWDDDRVNVGLYKATETEVVPLKYLYEFGPGVTMILMPIAFILSFILFVALKLLINRFLLNRYS